MTEVKPPRRRRGSLSREEITEAALRLLDGEGENALTFVRLGRELQSSSTAVYRHFENRQDIIVSIADHLDGISLAGYEPTDDWRADLEEMAVRAWRTASEHPAAAAMAMSTITGGPNELRAVDLILRALNVAGLKGRDAVLHYQAYVSLVLGSSTTQAERLTQAGAAGATRTWAQEYSPIDPEQFPYADAVKDELRLLDPYGIYLTVVRTYLVAVESAVRSESTAGETGFQT